MDRPHEEVLLDRTPQQVITLVVPCDPSAPRAIRSAVGNIPALDELRGDLMLVASELVTNAVIHSGGAGQDPVRVTIWASPGHALISVLDPGISGQAAEPTRFDDDAPGGWGLQIVDQLAIRWGTERRDGYRVWAEMAV
jgi:anti-sigma regulatory factor (Ser/Thr protein kinase)